MTYRRSMISSLAVTVIAGLFLFCLAPISSAQSAGLRYIDPIFSDVLVSRDVTFGAAVNDRGENQDLQLDLYEPSGDTHAARPVVVLAHGGAFVGGAKENSRVVSVARALAQRGWVVASIEYRIASSLPRHELAAEFLLGDSAAIRDAQHDMQAAVRWFRANASTVRIDPEAIAVGGTSAGAIAALETNFNPEDPGESGNEGWSSDVAAAFSLSGASDIRRIEAGAPPILMFHGTNDATVPMALAAETCAGTRAMRNTCVFNVIPGGGHTFIDQPRYEQEVIAGTSLFLCRRVVADCVEPAP